ncbi:uncharacterized protein LOC110863178 isoform X2 [Folsomia candida]|uniref:Putative diacylglycerol O-acyltransferase tgs1 n=1 Tax=Folsomia candida TaxID=158441 RepID=A0A226EZK4_FOLCA|nr:uncharacterized protein LOC110863178 isoform X2 [Folsomia candida]OXA63003.1 putative diacylglycerol O-acyltransferase tgs1 [Folsomia candida]
MFIPLVFWIFIIILVLPVYVLVLTPLAVWRLCVNLIAYLTRPDIVASLDSRDLVFTGDDYYGRARKSVISSIILNGPATLNTLKERFTKNVLDKPHFFKMRSRPYVFMGYWFWRHVEIQEEEQFAEVGGILSEDELNEVLPSWVSEGFSPGTPLWNIKLIHLAGNRTAVVLKIHHIIGDGVSFMSLLEEFCDKGWSNLQTSPVRPFSFAHWAYAWYNFPWTALKAFRLARIRKGFRPKAIGGPAFTCYTNFPMEKLRAVRRAQKCIFPTVLAGVLSGAFYKFFQSTGKKSPASVRMIIPTPYPNRPDKGTCNHVGWLHSEMPLGDPLAMKKFEDGVRYSYISGLHGIMWQIFKPMYLLPAPSLSVYTDWGEKNLPPAVLTSIPGSITPVYLLGQEVDHSYPTLSLGYTTGCNACMTTYNDGAYLSIRISKEIISSKEMLDVLVSKYMHEELELMYQNALNKENGNAVEHIQINVSN